MRRPIVSLCLTLSVLALAPIAKGQEASEKQAASLAGRYSFVSGEKNGGEAPEESLKDSKVSITAKEIIATDRSNKRTYMATYTLDTSKKPWRISMESLVPTIGAKAEGLVAIEGDTLKIVYALPGSEAPREFRTKEGQHLWVLKAMEDPASQRPSEEK